MKRNNGKSFEHLARQIFQEIINQDLVRNIVVKNDVHLTGISANHQIDIFWEFQFGSVNYKTVVEVKDWQEAVDQGEVMKFRTVLDDLPDQPRGVMVSRAGFQIGARRFAAANGIVLYELREPAAADLKGRVRILTLTLVIYHSRTSRIRLLHDEAWRISEALRLRLNEAPRLNLRLEPDEAQLLDSDGNQSRTVQDVIDDLYPQGLYELPPTRARHDFSQSTFLVTHNPIFPKLKLRALEATISTIALEQEVILDVKDFVRYILIQTLTGEVQTFDHQLRRRDD